MVNVMARNLLAPGAPLGVLRCSDKLSLGDGAAASSQRLLVDGGT